MAHGQRGWGEYLVHGDVESKPLKLLDDLPARLGCGVRHQAQAGAQLAQLDQRLDRAVDRLIANVQHAVDVQQDGRRDATAEHMPTVVALGAR